MLAAPQLSRHPATCSPLLTALPGLASSRHLLALPALTKEGSELERSLDTALSIATGVD